jgi:hypothetical protein
VIGVTGCQLISGFVSVITHLAILASQEISEWSSCGIGVAKAGVARAIIRVDNSIMVRPDLLGGVIQKG